MGPLRLTEIPEGPKITVIGGWANAGVRAHLRFSARLIFGGSGNDTVAGNRGHDTAFVGSGEERFRWDPGDGSDIIDGCANTDTLIFNVANASEKMSLSPNGHHTVFLRDVANIRMDMDNVEQLNSPRSVARTPSRSTT